MRYLKIKRIEFVSIALILISCANMNNVNIHSQEEANHRIEYRFKRGQHKLFANESVLYGVTVHESLNSIKPIEIRIGNSKLQIDSFKTLENGNVLSEYLIVTSQTIGDSVLNIHTNVDTFSVKLDSIYRRIDIHGNPNKPRIAVILTNYPAFE